MGGMLINFLFYYLFFIWVSVAFFKMGIPARIYNLGKKTGNKKIINFLDEWSECSFCVETWLSCFLGLLLYFSGTFGQYVILFGPCSVGLNYIIKGLKI